MTYEVEYTASFRKDVRLAQKQGFDLDKLKVVLYDLSQGKKLDSIHRDHKMVGSYRGMTGCRDCHVQNDWTLIYRIDKSRKPKIVLIAIRFGLHSKLFWD